MSNLRLTTCDAVIAIPENILVSSIQSLFNQEVLKEEIKIAIGDPKRKKHFEATFGVPKIKFQYNSQHGPRALMSFPVISGGYYGGKVIETDDEGNDKIVEVKKSWAGKNLSYEVPLNTEIHAFHDRELTIQAIYLELTQAKNVDFEQLGLDPDEGAELEADLGKTFAYSLQHAFPKTRFDAKDQPPRLFIGKVDIPQVSDTSGPLHPKTSRHSITMGEPTNEFDFMLYIYDKDDPRLASSTFFTFSTPWAGEKISPESDSVLVLSQSIVIEQLIKPVLIDKVLAKNDKLHKNLETRPLEKGSDIVKVVLEPTPDPSKKDVLVTSLEAYVRGDVHSKSSLLDITFEAKKIESLDLKSKLDFLPDWVPLPDLSAINVIVGQRHHIIAELEIVEGERFNIKQTTKSKENLDPEFELNFQGHWYENILKVVMLLIAPIFMIIATVADFLIEGLLDSANMEGLGQNLSQGVNDLADKVDLPGATIFKYGDPHFKDGNLIFDGKRIQLPDIRTTSNKPFHAVGMPPEIMSLKDLPVEKTEAVFLGEAPINHQNVNDPALGANQAKLSPYYILRREQYWERGDIKRRSGLDQQTIELSATVGVSEETEKRMSDTLHMSMTANGGLEFKGANIGVEASISRELQLETTRRVSASKEETHTENVEFPSTDAKPYIVALWVLVDRFSLRRMDNEEIDSYTIRYKNHIVEMGFPAMEWRSEENSHNPDDD